MEIIVLKAALETNKLDEQGRLLAKAEGKKEGAKQVLEGLLGEIKRSQNFSERAKMESVEYARGFEIALTEIKTLIEAKLK